MFFFLTLYMQNVLALLGDPDGRGLPSALLRNRHLRRHRLAADTRVGTRPLIVIGALIAAGGLYWLSRIPRRRLLLTDLLPGMFVMSVGIGGVFVGLTTAANAGVPADEAGLAAALAQRLAAGRRLRSAWRSSPRSRPRHTHHLLVAHSPVAAGAHCRLPAGAACRQHLHPRLRGDRPARHQHPRRSRRGDRRRLGAS